MRMITIVGATANEPAKRLEGWIAALRAAEARAAAVKDARWWYFLINYRVGSSASKTKGTDAVRRHALVQLIEALAPRERHISTSTYVVRTRIAAADELIGLLVPPLDADLDGLHVSQISPTNRAHRGETGLKH